MTKEEMLKMLKAQGVKSLAQPSDENLAQTQDAHTGSFTKGGFAIPAGQEGLFSKVIPQPDGSHYTVGDAVDAMVQFNKGQPGAPHIDSYTKGMGQPNLFQPNLGPMGRGVDGLFNHIRENYGPGIEGHQAYRQAEQESIGSAQRQQKDYMEKLFRAQPKEIQKTFVTSESWGQWLYENDIEI